MTGLRRAALAVIKTRSWRVEGEPLEGEQVAAFYHALPDTRAACSAVGVRFASRSNRRFDRAAQILRKAGLIEYIGGLWRRVGEGQE